MDIKFILVLVAFYAGINNAVGQSCQDIDNCAQWPTYYCKTYKEYMKTNCPNKCGYCTGPTTPTVCQDKNTNCDGWKNSGYCDKNSQYYDYMKTNCVKTCGLCETVTTPLPTKPTRPTTKPTTKPTRPTQPSTCSTTSKLQSCSFDSDTCDFIDVPFDDDSDFQMKSSGGQNGGGYISASGRGKANLIFPLELLVPHNGNHGNMCMEFYYRSSSSSGSLYVHQVRNAKNYPKNTKVSLSGSQSSWKKTRFTFAASQSNHLLIEASPDSGSIDIDNVHFCDGSCQ